jgi:hypothetical protein
VKLHAEFLQDLLRLASTRESFSLAAALIGFVVGTFVGTVTLPRPTAPIFGQGSVADIAAVTGAVLSAVVFGVAMVLSQARRGVHWRLRLRLVRRVIDGTGLTLLHAAISLLAVAGAFWVFGQAFQRLELDPAAGSICVGMAGAVVCYLAGSSATSMRTSYLSVLIAIYLAMGAMSSALNASNPVWWQTHFSSLGAAGDFSGVTFNFTLVLTGVVLTTLADYLTHDLSLWAEAHAVPERRVQVVRVGFVLLGIMLALVGLVPVNVNFTAHNTIAYGLVGVFAGLLVAIPLLFPQLSQAFNLATIFIAVLLLINVVLHMLVGYLNVTAFEMIGVSTMFVWLVLLIRTINAAVDDQESAGAVTTPAT